MAEKNVLGWVDYLIIAVMLCISSGIGIYYRLSGKRQKTTEEYFVANRSMSVLPVSVAMVVSFISGIAYLSLSAENYIYGTLFNGTIVSVLLGALIVYYGFLPVFFKLQTMSAYEYLEKRFGIRVRMIASFIYWILQLLCAGLVLCAPSVALETTTGISKTASIIIIGLVCAVYSSIGGIKAVLITDVFQGLLMFTAVFLVIGTAVNEIGLGQIWEIARQGQRLVFDSIDLDPTLRLTWWSVILGGLGEYLSTFAVSQVQIQRILTLKKMKSAQRAILLSCPIMAVLLCAIGFSGLAIYSKYHNCDPFLKKRITSPDMLMPLYVMDTMSNIPGLSGLVIAGVFSASLSTISAALNSLAAVLLEDYVKPIHRKCTGHEVSSAKSARIAKVFAFTFGIITIAVAFLVQLFGGLLEASFTISGIVGGPLLGIFTLGMGTESATEGGVIIGAFTALSFLLWISFGQPRPIPPKLPTTIEGCDNNVTNITMSVLQNITIFSKSTDDSSYFYLYRISYMWYASLGFLITFILGLLVSNLSRYFTKNRNDELDTNLFFPVIARRIRKRRRNYVQNKGITSLLNRRCSLSEEIHEKDDVVDKINTNLH